MRFLPILLILLFFCDASKKEVELYKHLLANYSAFVRPVRDPAKALKVAMRVFLQQIIDVDEQNQIVEVNAWLKFIWNDYRLRWRPTRYDNISSLRFQGEHGQIWQPDVLLYNSADERFDSSFKSNLVVYHTGEVNWIPPGIFKMSCKMDITMFPFDEQVCFMKFGSWTYHGYSLDLQIDSPHKTAPPSMDLSTYIPNGEWHLIGAPAVREVTFYKCCPEPYPTIKFYIHIRRRALFHMFNVIIPSMLISLMTLLAFCLPATDMSEKIGFQTTILLSVCFFLTILTATTPTTSEALPLLGVFFSTVTFIVSMSTAFTIGVLNIRYRQHNNHEMTVAFRRVFLEFIPWLVLMKRPHRLFRRKSALDMSVSRSECVQCASDDGDTASVIVSRMGSEEPLSESVIGSRLGLERKVGEGIFLPRRIENEKRRQHENVQKAMVKTYQLVHELETTPDMTVVLLDVLAAILDRIRRIRGILDRRERKKKERYDWKFAAMALDRLCLVIFTIFLTATIAVIFFAPPYVDMT